MKLKILGYAIYYSTNQNYEDMHCNFDVAPAQPLLIGDNHVFSSQHKLQNTPSNTKKDVIGQITVYKKNSPTSGMLSFDEAGISKFLDKDEPSFLHAEVYIGDIGFSQLLNLLHKHNRVELELFFSGLNFINAENELSSPTITWQKNKFETTNAGTYEVEIDAFKYSFKEKISDELPGVPQQKIDSNYLAHQPPNNSESINSGTEKLEFRCPSCQKFINVKPPTICPSCKLGIPAGYEAMQTLFPKYTSISSATDMHVELKNEMPLDAYARKLKKAGF